MATRSLLIGLLIGILGSGSLVAWDRDLVISTGVPQREGEHQLLGAAPCVLATSRYTIGDLWFPGIYTVGLALYTGYYPGSSYNMQVFQSGLWMGGRCPDAGGEPWTAIATFDRFDFLKYDTVCSGFNIASPGYSSVDVESRFDTRRSPRDLGVEVTLRYMMWDDPRLDDFIVIRAGLKFNKNVDDFWFGWMSDCDVGNNDLPDYYYDDLVGYDETNGIAYMYDDDGDPAVGNDPRSKLLSPTYVGQVLLAAPSPGGSIRSHLSTGVSWKTFCWWDWNNDVTGDASAFDRVSSGTIKHYPPDVPFDYRIMTAVGPYHAEAGDSAVFYLAMVFGEGFDQTFWSRRAKSGGDVSDLGSLVEHAEQLRAFVAKGLKIDDPAPRPPMLAQPTLDGKIVTFSWESISEEDDDFAGYRVYRSIVSNTGPWELIRDFNSIPYEHTCQDTLRIGFPTFYLVTAYDLAGNESTRGNSRTKTLNGVYAATPASDSGLGKIIVAPNPYRGSADWERLDYEGKIFFLNLPKQCTIWIYTIAGDLVDVVYHNVPGDDSYDGEGGETGGEHWDMVTSNGQSIASGIYIYRVTSPEHGEKIGKFAVIKGER